MANILYDLFGTQIETAIAFDHERLTSAVVAKLLHTIMFEDGRHKTLGIILPCDNLVEHYQFSTNTSERIEIIGGACEVKINGEEEFSYYRAGQSFVVEGNSGFNLRTEEIVQYVCHLEG